MVSKLIVVLAVVAVAAAQRSPYAGRRPVGYPSIIPTPAEPENELINRIGKETAPPATRRTPTSTRSPLPLEARGDWELVERISKMPVERQPFWFINWKLLEDHRKQPQTYPQRVNTFIDSGSDGRIFFN